MGVSTAGAFAASACPPRNPPLPDTPDEAHTGKQARKSSSTGRSVAAAKVRRQLTAGDGDIDEGGSAADIYIDTGANTNADADADAYNAAADDNAAANVETYDHDPVYNDDDSAALPEVTAMASKAWAATCAWAGEAATALSARVRWFVGNSEEKGAKFDASARARHFSKTGHRKSVGKNLAKNSDSTSSSGSSSASSTKSIRSTSRIKGVRHHRVPNVNASATTTVSAAAHANGHHPNDVPAAYLDNPWVRRGLHQSPLVLPLYHACGGQDARTSSNHHHRHKNNQEEEKGRNKRFHHASTHSAVSAAATARLNAACVRAVSTSRNASKTAAGCTNPFPDATTLFNGDSSSSTRRGHSSRSNREAGGERGVGWWSIVEQPANLWSLSDRLVSRAEEVISEHAHADVPLMLILSLPHLEEPLAPPMKFLKQEEADVAASALAAKLSATTTGDFSAYRHASPFPQSPSAAAAASTTPPDSNMLPRKRYRLRRGAIIDTWAEESLASWHSNSNSSSSSISTYERASWPIHSSSEQLTNLPQGSPLHYQRQRSLRSRERRSRGSSSLSSSYSSSAHGKSMMTTAAAITTATAAAAGGTGVRRSVSPDWDASLLAHQLVATQGAAKGKAMAYAAALREGDDMVRGRKLGRRR